MNGIIVHSLDPITLVGGGDADLTMLSESCGFGPEVVAVDGGAPLVLANGMTPRSVIGDLDSISAQTRAVLAPEVIHHIPEQETTDFDKALRSIRAPLILGVGFLGGRLDHQLANLNTLLRHPAQRCILIGAQDIVFLAPPSMRMDLPMGTPLGLFPMGAAEGVSEGLEWPIAGLNFAPDGRVGTSNRVNGPLFLSFVAPKMLVTLPRSVLGQVVRDATQAIARWPAL